MRREVPLSFALWAGSQESISFRQGDNLLALKKSIWLSPMDTERGSPPFPRQTFQGLGFLSQICPLQPGCQSTRNLVQIITVHSKLATMEHLTLKHLFTKGGMTSSSVDFLSALSRCKTWYRLPNRRSGGPALRSPLPTLHTSPSFKGVYLDTFIPRLQALPSHMSQTTRNARRFSSLSRSPMPSPPFPNTR